MFDNLLMVFYILKIFLLTNLLGCWSRIGWRLCIMSVILFWGWVIFFGGFLFLFARLRIFGGNCGGLCCICLNP